MNNDQLSHCYNMAIERIKAEAEGLRSNLFHSSGVPVSDIGKIRYFQSEFNKNIRYETTLLYDALVEYKEANQNKK